MKLKAILITMIAGALVITASSVLAEEDAAPDNQGQRGRREGLHQRRGPRGVARGQRRKERCARLKEADTNDDGAISYDEFKAAAEKRIQERFNALDRNGDGVLNKDDRELARQDHDNGVRDHGRGRGQRGRGPKGAGKDEA